MTKNQPKDVFISSKNLDDDGVPTRDSQLARTIYDYLTSRGLAVFFSNISLEQLGIAEYTRAIDDALDAAKVLVAVGTSRKHLDSKWVRYEWNSFFNDTLSGVKPEGRLFGYVDGVDVKHLPRALRQNQIFVHDDDAVERLHNFIRNALGIDRMAGEALEPIELNFGKSEYLQFSHPNNVAAEPDMVVQIPAYSEIDPIPEYVQSDYLDLKEVAELRESGVVTFPLSRNEFDFTHELTIGWLDNRQEWVVSVYRNWLECGANHDESYSGPYQLDDYCRGKLLEAFKIQEGTIAKNLISTSDPERLRNISEQAHCRVQINPNRWDSRYLG